MTAGWAIFDSSVGGLGGCPFSPGASGNVATERVVWMMENMGISTGINFESLMVSSAMAMEIEKKSIKSVQATPSE